MVKQPMDRLKKLAAAGKINEEASIRDSHSIIINSTIEDVWNILTDVKNWPSWNPLITEIDAPSSMEPGAVFSWDFNGTGFRSEVQSLQPNRLFSWTSRSKWVKSIHVWQLESDDNQTIATISTSLQGGMTVLVKSHQTIYNELLVWLEALQKASENKS